MVKPVAIYKDKGTSEVGIASLKLSVPQYLDRPVQEITAAGILAGELANYAMLIIPGGADLPYCEKLNGAGNLAIRQFVEQGGVYLGICAGAYYGCQAIDFIGEEYRVSGERELGFFDGLAQGCLPQWTGGKRFTENVQSKAAVEITLRNGERLKCYYHGGPQFLPNTAAIFEPLATYPDGTLAMVAGRVGEGYYLLSGVHFELNATAYQQVIQEANAADRLPEQRLAQLFTENYGKSVWLQIQQAGKKL